MPLVQVTYADNLWNFFSQTWINNMSKTTDPKLTKSSGEDFTKITFSPDLTKFKMSELEDDIIQLMERRAYDIAASTRGVKVFLNSERVKVNIKFMLCLE